MDVKEREYLKFVEREIRKSKKGTLFYAPDDAQRSGDIAFLITMIATYRGTEQLHILEKQRKVLIVRDEQEAMKLLQKSSKGSVIMWKDGTGINHVLLNMGNTAAGKKQALAFKGELDRKTTKQFLSLASAYIITADVKRIYEKLYRRQVLSLKKKPVEKILNPVHQIDTPASGFEKNFKNIIRSIGGATSVLQTAQIMVASMTASEKKALSQQFRSAGVRTAGDLKTLLGKWQREALRESKQVQPRLRRQRAVMELSR